MECPNCKSKRVIWRPQRPMSSEWWWCRDCNCVFDEWGGERRILYFWESIHKSKKKNKAHIKEMKE